MYKKYMIAKQTLLILMGLLLCTSCDDTAIDPFDNEGKYFTIYGYLDILETQHEVRVIPVTRREAVIESPTSSNANIDAVVTSTDLTTGEIRRWGYALEELEDGTFGHIFRSSFLLHPGRTYRLEVTRSDGIVTSAETTIPVVDDPALFERGPVVFEDDSTRIYQDIVVPRIPSPWDIQAIYLWGGGTINRRVYVPYGRRGERTEDGWKLTIEMTEDQAVVRQNIDESIEIGTINESTLVAMTSMGLQIRILDEKWDPPEGVFDPDALSLPGSFSNVENGYGFWGAIGLYIQEWNICDLSTSLGYEQPIVGC